MFTKAFRLFVSSTFADFSQERDVLHDEVFPALDAYCSSKGYQFLPLDLRWGVNEEAQLDQRTAEICLGEVRAAKDYPHPNFLIMVGSRYGWVPLPYAIARDEFAAITAWLVNESRLQDVAVLAAVYQPDENHLVQRHHAATEREGDPFVSAYVLRSRDDEVPELRSAEAWAQSESRTRRVLQEAADALFGDGEIDAQAYVKYFLSLTEQEIVDGLPGYGAGGKDEEGDDGPHAIVFFRDIEGQRTDRDAPASVYFEHEPRLDPLRSRLKQVVPAGNILSERVALDEYRKLDAAYLARFGAAIQHRLEAAVDRQIALVSAAEQAADAALSNERAAHAAFAEERRRIFVGREDALRSIERFITGEDDLPLIVHGLSGLGKSALMARAVAAAEAARREPVVFRFVGASAASSDLRSLLTSLVEDLSAHDILTRPGTYEGDIQSFCAQIQGLISSITKPVTIFLDALDQLGKPHRLDWLPGKLPAGVRLVMSTLNDAAYEADSGIYRSLRQRLAQAPQLAVEPLSSAQGRDMVRALERDAARRLRDNQRDYLVERFESAGASPLYLKTAFEIARGWKSKDVPGKGRCVLAGDTAGLIEQFIRDLSEVYHHEVTLVTRVLGYLAAAKNGLSAKELTDILSRDTDVMRAISSERHGARTGKLPPSIWVRLNRQLAPFLAEKRADDQPLLQFFHRQVADVARRHYEPGKSALHRALADYFESRVVTRDGKAVYEKRSLSELPYQFHHCDAAVRLNRILMSPSWMQQKLAALGPRLLSEDYQFAFTDSQRLIGRTMQLVLGILTRDGRQLLPQLIGRLMTFDIDDLQDFLQRARAEVVAPAIVPLRPGLLPPGTEIARLDGYDMWGRTLVSLPGNRVATGSMTDIRILNDETGEELCTLHDHGGAVYTLALLDEHALASAAGFMGQGSSEDPNFKIWIWDLDALALRRQLQGHTGSINAIVRMPDGRFASGAEDGTIRLWDWPSGDCVRSIETHDSAVNDLAVLPDGRVASASRDHTIRIWDIGRGTELGCLVGHTDAVTALAALPDGRLASGSNDGGVVRVWDPDEGADRVDLATGTDVVTALTVLPDGRLASGSRDGTLCFWNLDTMTEAGRIGFENRAIGRITPLPRDRLAFRSTGGRTIHILDTTIPVTSPDACHDKEVTALCRLPGNRIASASADRTIKIWDAGSGRELAKLTGHREGVTALAVLPDNRLASGSADKSICIWDLKDGSKIKTLEGHTWHIGAFVLLPDGRLASGASEIILWDVNEGRETARLVDTGGITALAMHPSGRLVSAIAKPTVRFWDLATCQETSRLELFMVRGMAISPDGHLILGHPAAMAVYNASDGTQLARFNGHKAQPLTEIAHPRSIALLPNGMVASAASDLSIRVWNPKNGEQAACLEVDSRIMCLAAVADGRLVAGDARGRLHWLDVV